MLADHAAIGGYEFSRGIRKRVALLGKICVKKILVVATGNKTDFLGVRLFGQRQTILASEVANLGLIHSAKRKQSPAELLLCESEEKIRLVLGAVCGTLQPPATARIMKFDARIMPGRYRICADLLCHGEQLIELQVIVAEAARNRSSSRQIFLHKRAHYVALEPVLMI